MYFSKIFFINLVCISFSNFGSEYTYNPKWTRNDSTTYHATRKHKPIRVQRTQEWQDIENYTRYILLAIALPYLPPFAAIQAEELSRTPKILKGLSYVQAQYNENLTKLTLEEVRAIDKNKRVLITVKNAWTFQPTLEIVIDQFRTDQRKIFAEQLRKHRSRL